MTTTREAILAALPGTSAQLSERTKMGIGPVRRALRRLQDRGEVRRYTRWIGNKAYPYVYRRHTVKKGES